MVAECPRALLEAQVAETQRLLGSLIQRPPLTQQRLARPPVKYLRDIFVEVAAETGCGAGVFSTEELEFSTASPPAKLAFLTALVRFAATASGEPALEAAGPEGMLSGTDPGAANLMLQALHRAATAEACRPLWPAAAQAARSAWSESLPAAETPPAGCAGPPPVAGPAWAPPAGPPPALEETIRPARPASAAPSPAAQLGAVPAGAGGEVTESFLLLREVERLQQDTPARPARLALQDRPASPETSPRGAAPASAGLLEAPRLRSRPGSAPCANGGRHRRTPTAAARTPEARPARRRWPAGAAHRLPGVRVAGEHPDLDRWTKADALETMLKKLAVEKEALQVQNGTLQQQCATQQALCKQLEAELRELREEWAAMAVYNRHLRTTQKEDADAGADVGEGVRGDDLPTEQEQLMELCHRAEAEGEAIEGGPPTVPSRGQALVVQQLCDEVAALRVRSKEAICNEARAYRRLGRPVAAFRELDEGTRPLEEQLRECREIARQQADAHADLVRQADGERQSLEERCEELAFELERGSAERAATEARAAELDRLDVQLQARAAELRAVLQHERQAMSADWAELNAQKEKVQRGAAELAAERKRADREKAALRGKLAAELASLREKAAEELEAQRDEVAADAAARLGAAREEAAAELAEQRAEAAAELAAARGRMAAELAKEWDKEAAAIATKHRRAAAEAAAKVAVHLAAVRGAVAAEIAENESVAAERAAELHRLAAERKEASAELKRATAEIAAEKERGAAELAAERERAAAELAAERQKAAAELAAERQSVAAELAALPEHADHEKERVASLERLIQEQAADLAGERERAARLERQALEAEEALAATQRMLAAERGDKASGVLSQGSDHMLDAHFHLLLPGPFEAEESRHPASARTDGIDGLSDVLGQSSVASGSARAASRESASPTGAEMAAPAELAEQASPTENAERAAATEGAERAALAGGAERAAPAGGPERAAATEGAERAAPTEGAERAAPTVGPERAAPTGGPERAAQTEGAEKAAPTELAEQAPLGLNYDCLAHVGRPGSGVAGAAQADAAERAAPAKGAEQAVPTMFLAGGADRRSSSSALAASLVASATPVLPQEDAIRTQRASTLSLQGLQQQLEELRADGDDDLGTSLASSGGSVLE